LVVLKTPNNQQKATRHHHSTPCALTGDFLRSSNCLVDNLFAGLWNAIKLPEYGSPLCAKSASGALAMKVRQAAKDDTRRWVKVRLLFVRAMVEGDKPTLGKHDWAVFLTTDRTLAPQRMLELYAMRWAIEVYFKEVKQHLGFTKEQGTHYASYIASMHLAAIRFCLLPTTKHQHQASNLPEMRRQLCANISHIDFASRMWQFFRALISGGSGGGKNSAR